MQSTENKCESCRNSEILEKDLSGENNSVDVSSPEVNVIYLKCTRCQIVQCKSCFKQHIGSTHLEGQANNSNEQQVLCEIICQECEQNDSNKFCQNCEQHLCEKCSFKIHNKGKRAKHQVLANQVLIKIQKLFFLNQSETQDSFKVLSNEFTPSNSLIVYMPERPSFIEDYEGLQVQNMSELTVQQIQSCLNRYPLISLFSINELEKELIELLSKHSVDIEDQQSQERCIFLSGFKITLQKRINSIPEVNSSNSGQAQDQEYDKVEQNDSQNDSLTTILKSNTEASSPDQNKFRKKQSIDFSCGSKQQRQPIPEMHKLFKKSLKMSNRSLIIQIPQTKQYKQSPIKSDREQGFIERNLNLLQNAAKNEQNNKTITLHLDQNYHDISESTMNLLQQSECKSNNEESILLMGMMQDSERDPERDTSFKVIGNDQSCSDMGNSIDDSDNVAATFSLLNVGSISLSTDNSIRKRSKKLPIPYFQPMKSKNIENLNNSYGYMFTQKTRFKLEKKFRELAENGTLMVSKKQLQQFNLKFDEKIIKKMKKNVCDDEIEYFSLNLELISVQSICWVLESIKQDRMMPSEKLVLSRLKQCFNIKPAHKLWICIIKYLQSSQYFSDKQQYDRQKSLPAIFIGKFNDEVLLQYDPKWPYEDQQEPVLVGQEWQSFKIFLNEYFKKSKQITGGRYGCVQYVKLNGPPKLRECSLGRLSYFVQQAINKGLIRYHKTLLIQNYESFEKSTHLQNNNMKLFDLQKQLKILTIQVTLIDIFLQAGRQNQVSLAQIPLTFKKMILFDVNLLELGFPKLKNVLHTLTDKLVLSSSKSHIKYQQIKSHQKIEQIRMKLQQMMQYFISQMSEIISSCMLNRHNIIAQELYNITNDKLGFVFDFRVCNVPDFYQFLIYYCHQIINLQFINGTFVAFAKHMGYMGYQYGNGQNIYYQNIQYGNQYPTNSNYYHNQNQHGYPQNSRQNHGQNGQYNNYVGNNMNSYNQGYNPNNMMGMNPPIPTYPGNYQPTWPLQPTPATYPTPYQTMYPQPQQKYPHIIPPPTQISTPKFNQSIQYINKKTNQPNIKTLQNFKWDSYLDVMSNVQDQQEKNNMNFQTESFTDYQSIYNILDDDGSEAKSKVSFPKTFIQKEGSCNHNQGELYISKITPINQKSDNDEQCDASLGLFDDSPMKDGKLNILQNSKNGKKQKGQHTRVYSTTQARTKHERMYSTTTAKN